jgi:hypothetical protein
VWSSLPVWQVESRLTQVCQQAVQLMLKGQEGSE